MADDKQTLDALREHNEQMLQLLSKAGRMELSRLVLLEMTLHAYTDARLSEYDDMTPAQRSDRLQSELQDLTPDEAEKLAKDIANFLKMPESVKNVGKKVGSVANSYVKKSAGNILGGDEDG